MVVTCVLQPTLLAAPLMAPTHTHNLLTWPWVTRVQK